MREVTTTQQVYTFEELSKESQQTAIDSWVYSEQQLYDHSDDITYEFNEFYLSDYGINDYELHWSLGYCQGDGVAFYGKTEGLDEIIKKLDLDTTLDVDCLTLEVTKCGPHLYNHYNTMEFTVNSFEELTVNQEKELLRLESSIGDGLRLLSQKLEKVGYNIIEFHLSEENAKDSIIANEYEYLKDGKQY